MEILGAETWFLKQEFQRRRFKCPSSLTSRKTRTSFWIADPKKNQNQQNVTVSFQPPTARWQCYSLIWILFFQLVQNKYPWVTVQMSISCRNLSSKSSTWGLSGSVTPSVSVDLAPGVLIEESERRGRRAGEKLKGPEGRQVQRAGCSQCFDVQLLQFFGKTKRIRL